MHLKVTEQKLMISASIVPKLISVKVMLRIILEVHLWLAMPLLNTVEPVYYGHIGTSQRCPDYQGVLIFQVSLYDKAPFGTIARCPDYAGVHIFKCPE